MDPLPPSLPGAGLPQPMPAGTAGLAILLAELTQALAKLPAGTQIPALVTQILPQPQAAQTPQAPHPPQTPAAPDPAAPKLPANLPGPLLQLSTPDGPAQVRVPATLPIPIPVGAKLEITIAAAGPQPQWRLTAIDGKPVSPAPLTLTTAAPPPPIAAPGPTAAPSVTKTEIAPPPTSAPGIPATLVKSADPTLPSGTTLLVRITNLVPPPTPQAPQQPSQPPPQPQPQPQEREAEPAPVALPKEPESAPAPLPAPAAPVPLAAPVPAAAPAPALAPTPTTVAAVQTPTPSSAPVSAQPPVIPPSPAVAPAPAPATISAPAPVPTSIPMASPTPTLALATAPTQAPAPIPVAAAPIPSPTQTAAPAPPPTEIGGEVLPNSDAGRPLVKTPVGLLALSVEPQSAPPAGAHVTLTVIGKPVPPAAPILPPPQPDDPPEKALPRRLTELVEQVQSSGNEKLAEAVRQAIPAPGPKLAAQLLSVIASAEQPSQGLPRWLGEGLAAALTHSAPEAMAQLSRQWEALSQPVQGPDNGDWRTLLMPLMMGGQMNLLRLTTRNPRRGATPAEREKGTRFLLDLDLSRLGPMQFDGLVKRQYKHFDLIIRTRDPLPGEMRRDIDGLFQNGLMNFGLEGSVVFKPDGRFIATPRLTGEVNGIIFA